VLGRDGRPVRHLDVHAWPLSMGRALNQSLVLDDPTVAANHATLAPDGSGALVLTVGNSINGVWLDGRYLAAGERHVLPATTTRLQMGHSTVLLRHQGESLAPELPLPAALRHSKDGAARLPRWAAAHPNRTLGAVAGLLAATTVAQLAVAMDPGADLTAWLPALVGLPAAVAAWCGAWALLSKLFQQRFEFGAHLRIALPGLLMIEVMEVVLPTLAAAAGWPLLWRMTPVLRVVLMALVVYRHLALLMPQHPQRAAAALTAATLVGGAINLAFTHRSTDRLSAAAYMATLPLPALNLTRAQPVGELLQALTPLADRLQKRVAEAADDQPDEGDDVE
jgi:hypothetical protein